MIEFKREPNRYMVIKSSDISSAFQNGRITSDDCADFLSFMLLIDAERESRGRFPLNCVCVEEDWPEFEKVWEMIEERVLREQLGITNER